MCNRVHVAGTGEAPKSSREKSLCLSANASVSMAGSRARCDEIGVRCVEPPSGVETWGGHYHGALLLSLVSSFDSAFFLA